MKRSPLRRTSKKRAAQIKVYSRLRREFIRTHLFCDVCKQHIATQIHHKDGREGKMLSDSTKWLTLCFWCHRKIHDEPKWAREQGYLI